MAKNLVNNKAVQGPDRLGPEEADTNSPSGNVIGSGKITFNFPLQGVSVRADSTEEAQEILKKHLASQGRDADNNAEDNEQ